MNKHKRNAKIATSLNEIVAQTKLSGKNFSVKVISRGKDGKKGTGDDKTLSKSKTKIKGSSLGEVSDTAKMYALMTKAMKAMPGSPKQKEIIKQLNVIRKSKGMKPLK